MSGEGPGLPDFPALTTTDLFLALPVSAPNPTPKSCSARAKRCSLTPGLLAGKGPGGRVSFQSASKSAGPRSSDEGGGSGGQGQKAAQGQAAQRTRKGNGGGRQRPEECTVLRNSQKKRIWVKTTMRSL